MINPHQRFGQRLLSLCKQQWSICTHQWDTEQLSNPQGKKPYCPTACCLVLMPLLEPREHSMDVTESAVLGLSAHPARGSSAHSSLFTVPHRSDQVSSVQTPVTALKVFSGIYLHSGRLEKPAPLQNTAKKLAVQDPEQQGTSTHLIPQGALTRANVLFNRAPEQTAFTNLLMLSTSSSSSARPCLLTARLVSITCILETVT